MSLSHILDTLDRIAGHETRLRTGLPELNRRARISSRRDGYPNRASGAQPGTHTSPREVYSTHSYPLTIDGQWWNWACTCGVTGITQSPSSFAAIQASQVHYDDAHGSQAVSYSDTCGESAIADNRPDPVAIAYRRLERIIERIERDSRSAVALLNQTLEPKVVTEGAGEEQWCRHHLTTIQKCEPRSVGDLCDFCRSYQRETRKLPTKDLLTKHHSGRRLTSKEIGA